MQRRGPELRQRSVRLGGSLYCVQRTGDAGTAGGAPPSPGSRTALAATAAHCPQGGESSSPGPVTRRGSIRFSVGPGAAWVEPEGPDGGWGWVVVAASFCCLCVLDGAAYTFGVFLDPLVEEMGGSRGRTSLAGRWETVELS